VRRSDLTGSTPPLMAVIRAGFERVRMRDAENVMCVRDVRSLHVVPSYEALYLEFRVTEVCRVRGTAVTRPPELDSGMDWAATVQTALFHAYLAVPGRSIHRRERARQDHAKERRPGTEWAIDPIHVQQPDRRAVPS
jgi:hypothetical protein